MRAACVVTSRRPLRPRYHAEYARYKDKYTWEQVQEEYARVATAESGNMKVMASQAKQVIKHIAVGRQTTRGLAALRRKEMSAIDEGGESQPESPASPATESPGSALGAKSGFRSSDPKKASPAEEYA